MRDIERYVVTVIAAVYHGSQLFEVVVTHAVFQFFSTPGYINAIVLRSGDTS